MDRQTNIIKKNITKGQQDGSAGKRACGQAWHPEFKSQKENQLLQAVPLLPHISHSISTRLTPYVGKETKRDKNK